MTTNDLTGTLGTRTASKRIQVEIDPFATIPTALPGIDGETKAELSKIANSDTLTHDQKVDAYIEAYTIGHTWSEGSDPLHCWGYETARYTASVDAVSAIATAGTKPVYFRVGYDVQNGFYCEPTELPTDAIEIEDLANPNPKNALMKHTYRFTTPKATRRYIFARYRFLAADGFLIGLVHHKSDASHTDGKQGYWTYRTFYSQSLCDLDKAMKIVPADVADLCDALEDAEPSDLTDALKEVLTYKVRSLAVEVRDAVKLLWAVEVSA